MAKAALLKPLQVLQNRILKTVTYKHQRYPTNALHSDLGTLKVSDIHVFKMCCLIFKYVYNNLPPVFNNIVNPCNQSHIYNNTRSNALFSVSRHNSKHGKLLLNNYCYKTWKNLPNNVKDSKTYATLKNKLKAHLIANYTD